MRTRTPAVPVRHVSGGSYASAIKTELGMDKPVQQLILWKRGCDLPGRPSVCAKRGWRTSRTETHGLRQRFSAGRDWARSLLKVAGNHAVKLTEKLSASACVCPSPQRSSLAAALESRSLSLQLTSAIVPSSSVAYTVTDRRRVIEPRQCDWPLQLVEVAWFLLWSRMTC